MTPGPPQRRRRSSRTNPGQGQKTVHNRAVAPRCLTRPKRTKGLPDRKGGPLCRPNLGVSRGENLDRDRRQASAGGGVARRGGGAARGGKGRVTKSCPVTVKLAAQKRLPGDSYESGGPDQPRHERDRKWLDRTIPISAEKEFLGKPDTDDGNSTPQPRRIFHRKLSAGIDRAVAG